MVVRIIETKVHKGHKLISNFQFVTKINDSSLLKTKIHPYTGTQKIRPFIPPERRISYGFRFFSLSQGSLISRNRHTTRLVLSYCPVDRVSYNQ